MPDAMCPVEVVRGVPVIAAPQEIDIVSAAPLRAALLEAAQGQAAIVVDMTQTRFCDTAGIHVLVLAHKQALAQGRQLRLVTSDANVLRIFAITGIDQVIPRFTSLEQALA